MKLAELIESRLQALKSLESRLALVRSDATDSDTNFQRRVDSFDQSIDRSNIEIAKLQVHIRLQQRLRAEMIEHREGGTELIVKLKATAEKLRKQINAVRISQIIEELRGLNMEPELIQQALAQLATIEDEGEV